MLLLLVEDSIAVVVDAFERLENVLGRGEHAIGEQERVQEVDAQESQIGQTFKEPLLACVSYLGQLAAVKRPAELDIDVVFVQSRVGSGFFLSSAIIMMSRKMVPRRRLAGAKEEN